MAGSSAVFPFWLAKSSARVTGKGVRISTPGPYPAFVFATALGASLAWLPLHAGADAGRDQKPPPSILPAASAKPVGAEVWESLFDGKTLGRWKQTPFGGGAEPEVESGVLRVESGEELSGVHWTGPLPKIGYELSLEAQRRSGLDFFCGLTFPVGEKHLTFVVGGWGGSTVGLSSIDHQDASQNATSQTRYFKDNQWYRIRVRVELERVRAWIDAELMADVDTRGKELGLRPGEIELSVPLGIATFRTSASFREIKLSRLDSTKAN